MELLEYKMDLYRLLAKVAKMSSQIYLKRAI